MSANPVPAADSVRFGDDFELSLRAYELRCAGIPLKLKPIPMELLFLLVEHRGELVTREQIVGRIWRKGTFLDTDNSINGAISRIRQVLRDDPEQPRFVQTVTGKGYKFIAPVIKIRQPVTVAGPTTPAASPESLIGQEGAHLRIVQVTSPRRWHVLIGISIALIAALGGFQWSRSRVHPQPSNGRLMLAVLPFENLTGDAGQEYFSDGMTEEMITQLGSLNPDHLGVIARTSVMHYKHSQEQLDQIGHELRVQYLIEGSVRRDSDNVRITAQLIQVKDQTRVWARQYNREVKNLLIAQGEIAQEIADEIDLTLGNPHAPKARKLGAAASPSPSYEVYDLYLKGRYFLNKRTAPGFQQAAEYFQEAIAKDPNYARAYAGLADTFGLMTTWYLVPKREFMPKARTAALRALQIDETLAEAHTSLALIAETYDFDWQTAEKEFRLAIQLDPDYSTAHQWYAEYLAWQGRFDEALAESERARQLDPLSLIIATDHGAILYFWRKYDRAIAQSRAVLDMDPTFARARTFVIFASVQEGRFAEALDEVQRFHGPDDSPWTWAWKAYVYGQWGRMAQAQHALAKVEQIGPHSRSDMIPALLLAYIGTGRKDQAIALLQKACSEHSNAIVELKVDPNYDPLRNDPRFQDLLRRVGLAN